MKGYKAFEKGMICKSKQYAENTVFEEDAVEIRKKGMHFCENPLDCLNYYRLINDNGDFTEFAEVKALEIPVTDDNKIFATKKLKIGKKLSMPNFIKASIDFLIEKVSSASSFGLFAQIGNSDDFAKIGSSGGSAQIANSGNSAQIGSSGVYAQIGNSGEYAQIVSSGNSAQIGSSGYSALIGSIGEYAKIVSSGNSTKICSSGNYAVICCAGQDSIVRAKKESWITLAEWKYDESKDAEVPICVKTEFVDGKKIKADTWYTLKDGKFVEV